jgi:serine O-acetyltransferase
MPTLRDDIAADVAAAYDGAFGGWRLAVRAASNPSVHAVALLRLTLTAPATTRPLWRNLLIAKHSIDVGDGASIGPGLYLPHPLGIVIGRYARVGARARLYQHVTLGSKTHHDEEYPTLEDDVVVYPGTVIAGPVRIGAGAVIGANSFVARDVDAGAVVHGTW